MALLCNLYLLSLGDNIRARLVRCMLAIKDVDEDEATKIVDADVSKVGDPRTSSMLPGQRCCWDEEPEATWSKHVESLLDLPVLPVLDSTSEPTSPGIKPAPGESDDIATEVEKPKARMMPHDEPELIAGNFTIISFPTERQQADPSFLKKNVEENQESPRGLFRIARTFCYNNHCRSTKAFIWRLFSSIYCRYFTVRYINMTYDNWEQGGAIRDLSLPLPLSQLTTAFNGTKVSSICRPGALDLL